jgi:hypothetical protein
VCRFHVAAGAKLRPRRGAIYKLSGAVAKLASINLRKLVLSPTGSINVGFILREDLLCSSYLPLGVPNWAVIYMPSALRTDPNTFVDTLIENAKQKHGVEVAKSKAYRARLKALQVMLGDHKAQYTRIRDYLQAVIDTNPGSRCIVTTRQLVEHPSPNPRFHGLFYCLNASKQGFLNGCMPFLGKLSEIS